MHRDRGTCLHDIAKEFMESHIGEVLDPAKADEYAEEIREIACDVVGARRRNGLGFPSRCGMRICRNNRCVPGLCGQGVGVR